MIFRAIFWIGLVAILMPHEPDLGFGRPASVDTGVAGEVASWAKAGLQPSLADPQSLCRRNAGACATGVTLLDAFRSAATRSLAEVKADIQKNGKGHRL
jgi:hypothetical protein